MPGFYDKKAVRILFDRFWSAKGWKKESERITSPEDFEYAVARGVMFHPVIQKHDDVVPRVLRLAARIRPESVGEAFLYSLTTRDLAFRSALGSYAASAWMPEHVHSGSDRCAICGEYDRQGGHRDLNVLNFERLKWGGVRHDQLFYQVFDLKEFEKLPSFEATANDYEVLRSILDVASSLAEKALCGELEKSIAGLFPSSKPERSTLLQIMSYAGIIAPRNRPGYFREWPVHSSQEVRPASKIDWTYPIMWWQGRDGVNYDAVDYYFPLLRNSTVVH